MLSVYAHVLTSYCTIVTFIGTNIVLYTRYVHWDQRDTAQSYISGYLQGTVLSLYSLTLTMGRQHQRVDWPGMEYTTTESREPQGVEEAGCKIYSGAPTVSQTTG